MARCAVIPTEDAVSLPLLHYVNGLIRASGHLPVTVAIDDPLHDVGLVVGFGAGCRRAADSDRGVWLSPDFGDPLTATALGDAKGPGLVVGSLLDEGWDRAAAARLRQFEILHLTRVDRLLEIAGDPMGSIEVMKQILGRIDATIRRVP